MSGDGPRYNNLAIQKCHEIITNMQGKSNKRSRALAPVDPKLRNLYFSKGTNKKKILSHWEHTSAIH